MVSSRICLDEGGFAGPATSELLPRTRTERSFAPAPPERPGGAGGASSPGRADEARQEHWSQQGFNGYSAPLMQYVKMGLHPNYLGDCMMLAQATISEGQKFFLWFAFDSKAGQN